MKNLLCIFFIIFFCSCQSIYTKNEVILEAEKLLDTSPDSAFILLSTIKDPIQLSKADYAAWCLHYTHAQYKLHKEINSDELIKKAISYYSKSKEKKYYGISWYLYGCIYRQQHNNKEAILAFKKAEDILQKTNEENVKGLIYFNIGYISMQDELYAHSLNYFKKALNCFQHSNNKKFQAYAYRDISYVCTELKYPDKIISQNLDIALKLANESNDSANYYDILVRKGKRIYNADYNNSKKYILQGYNFFPDQRPYYAAYLAYIYSKLNIIDSANYYLRVSLENKSSSQYKIIGYMAAEIIAKNKNDYKQAYFYIKKSYLLRDSTFNQKIKSQLYRIDKQYNLAVKEKENAELQLLNRNILVVITLLIIFVLVGVVIALIKMNRAKLINAQNKLEKEQLSNEKKQIELVNAQKQEIIRLKLKQNIANTLELSELRKTSKESSRKDEFNARLAKQSILTEEVWKDYIDDVNRLYDNRLNRLKESCNGLTKMDMIVIALICLDVSLAETCILLNTEKNTMYVRRKTIKRRIGLQADIELEEWIINTIMQEFKHERS